jgi:hypothetical protein
MRAAVSVGIQHIRFIKKSGIARGLYSPLLRKGRTGADTDAMRVYAAHATRFQADTGIASSCVPRRPACPIPQRACRLREIFQQRLRAKARERSQLQWNDAGATAGISRAPAATPSRPACPTRFATVRLPAPCPVRAQQHGRALAKSAPRVSAKAEARRGIIRKRTSPGASRMACCATVRPGADSLSGHNAA